MNPGICFNWNKYLDLAKELATSNSNESNEAKLRSSISRAYYAAFCKARIYLRDIEKDPRLQRQNYSTRDFNVHEYVIEELRSRKKKEERELFQIGENLFRLRRQRNNADYDDFIHSLPSVVQQALREAELAISKLDACNSPPKT
jgi:uncharacterized protein (UPF0332 family)